MDVPAASLFMLLVLAMYRCDLFGSRPYSLLLGAAFGLGMMAKTSFIIYAAGPLAALLLAAWWRFFPTLQLRTAVALCAVLLLLGAKIGLGAVPTSTALQETGRSHLLFVVLLLACAAAFAAWTAWSRRVSETSGRRWLGPGRAVNLANLLGAVLLCLLICLPLYADNLTVLKTIMSHSHEAGTVMRPPPLSESPYKAIFLQAYSPLNALFFGVGFLASLLVPRLLKKNGLVLAAFPLAVANLLSFTYIDMRYLLPLFPLCALLGASWPALLRWARVPILLVLMAAGLLQMGIFGLAYYHHLDGPNMEGPKAQLVRLGVVRPGFSFYNAYHSGERDKARADAAVAEIFTALTELAAGKPITLVSCFEARSILSYGMMRSYSEVHRLPVTFIDIGHGRGAWPSEIPLQYGVFVVGSDGAAYPNRRVEGLVGAPARTVRLPDQYRALIYAYPAPVPFRILEYTRNPGG